MYRGRGKCLLSFSLSACVSRYLTDRLECFVVETSCHKTHLKSHNYLLIFMENKKQEKVKTNTFLFDNRVLPPVTSWSCIFLFCNYASKVIRLRGKLQLLDVGWRCEAKLKGQRSIKLNKTLADHVASMGPLLDSSGRIQFTPTQPWHVSLC